jgi:hypothetical protein
MIIHMVSQHRTTIRHGLKKLWFGAPCTRMEMEIAAKGAHTKRRLWCLGEAASGAIQSRSLFSSAQEARMSREGLRRRGSSCSFYTECLYR